MEYVYTIIRRETPVELGIEVSRLLDKGWELYGAPYACVVVQQKETHTYHHQAMTSYWTTEDVYEVRGGSTERQPPRGWRILR